MGIDSDKLKTDMTRFNEPALFFSQEFPSIRVTVQTFYMDKYEVTNAEFKEFIDANPRWSKTNIPDSLQDGNYLKDWDNNNYPKRKATYPVVYVCDYAANAYAYWKGKRLPMDVELEYAAKGGEQGASEFPWGDADADPAKANYSVSAIGHSVRVGSYKPNSLGIYDMAGNVNELCEDKWRPGMFARMATYKSGKAPYTMGEIDRKKVVIRGGSWNDPAVKLRNTWRGAYPVISCTAYTGFRCVANAIGLNNR
jgi:sulfatase modifying factor 1